MILHSSKNITRLQSLSTVQYLFPRAQARQPLTFASQILIFFRTTRLWKLFLYKQHLTVTLETTSSRFSLNFLVMSCNGNDLLFLRACEYPCCPAFFFCYFAVNFRCQLAHDIFLPLHTRLPCLAEDFYLHVYLRVRFSSFIISYNDSFHI